MPLFGRPESHFSLNLSPLAGKIRKLDFYDGFESQRTLSNAAQAKDLTLSSQ